jgi:hypothetical protein
MPVTTRRHHNEMNKLHRTFEAIHYVEEATADSLRQIRDSYRDKWHAARADLTIERNMVRALAHLNDRKDPVVTAALCADNEDFTRESLDALARAVDNYRAG